MRLSIIVFYLFKNVEWNTKGQYHVETSSLSHRYTRAQ